MLIPSRWRYEMGDKVVSPIWPDRTCCVLPGVWGILSPSVTARSLWCLSLDRGLAWHLRPISEMQFAIRSVGDLPGRTQKPGTGNPKVTVTGSILPWLNSQACQAERKP